MPKPAGYHFAANEDGSLAIEMDQPSEGYTTLTWRPNASFDSKPSEAIIPTALYLEASKSYVAESTKRQPK